MAIYPPLVLLTYLGAFFLRKGLHNRERQKWLHQGNWAVLFQPYTVLLVMFMAQFAYLVVEFWELLAKYKWLDPNTFTMPEECTSSDPKFAVEFAIPNFVRVLALLAPLLIGLTWIVTVVHWSWHLPKSRGYDEDMRWYPSFSHDLAMQVAALPLMYGIFALDSVLEMLRLLTGQYFQGIPHSKVVSNCAAEWDRLKLRTEQTYLTNTQLADLYEAWALRCFGVLCFTLVGRQINREVPTVKYILSTIKRHLESVACAESEDRSILADVKILTDPRNSLFKPLQQISRLGVRVFVWTYAMKSVYLLVLTFLAHIDLQLCGESGKFKPACSMEPYLDGACFLASTLAIYNIIVFEQNLSTILHQGQFRPFEKFLGVKVMVSICFIQSFVLDVLGSWLWDLSKEQINLCYACLLCCEVLPLSILLFVAWRPVEGDWHRGDFYGQLPDLSSRRSDSGARLTLGVFRGRGQLADEASTSFDDSLVFQKSRELSATLGHRPAFSDELTGIIELRGDVQAKEGKAVEEVVNNLSKSIRATYKPAALFRTLTPTSAGGSTTPAGRQTLPANIAAVEGGLSSTARPLISSVSGVET